MLIQKKFEYCFVFIILIFLLTLFASAKPPANANIDRKFNRKFKKYFSDKVSNELMKNYDVLQYRIDLRILPDEEEIFGKTTIKLKILQSNLRRRE